MKLSFKWIGLMPVIFIFLILVTSCNSKTSSSKEPDDSKYKGSINVSADESFKPIVDQLVLVYESNFPGTHINVSYKPEADCLEDLKNDSVRIVIVTRGYSNAERLYIRDSLHKLSRWMTVARDAVSVIIHPGSKDSTFTMREIKNVLTGVNSNGLFPVFDGVKATSTVRFVVDSILRNDSLRKDALAAKTSEEVINYVAMHPEAVGFIGASWVGNKDDSTQVSFLKKVKIAQLESTDIPGSYVLPVQANIYYRRYPMVRDLVYILKENHRGLGKGFGDFLEGQIGQLIFKRAYLMPATMKFTVRLLSITE